MLDRLGGFDGFAWFEQNWDEPVLLRLESEWVAVSADTVTEPPHHPDLEVVFDEIRRRNRSLSEFVFAFVTHTIRVRA